MAVAKILRIYLDEVPLNRARKGNFVFINRVTEAFEGVGYRVELRKNSDAERLKSAARRGLVVEGQATITGEEEEKHVRGYSNAELRQRNQGIPKLGGYLERPIESKLQYENVAKRVSELSKMSSDLTAWDADEIAYFQVNRLP